METTNLGSTGRIVSRVGLGLAALGRPGYINLGHAADLGGGRQVEEMAANAFAVLDAAHESGVRYFDAARSYGRAEEFLARWITLRKIDPGSVTVGSKWGYTYTADWQVEADRHEVKDHSLTTLLGQSAESRELLGDSLVLYQIHSATRESGVLDDREVLGELALLREEGWKIGLSLTGPEQAETLRKAMRIEVDGERLFDCVQATWNLLEPSAGPALEEASRAGLGVIIKEALANGRLTARNVDPDFADRLATLQDEADRLETTLDALSLAGVLARPWVDVVLSGAATPEQLRSNLSASTIPWDDETEGRLRSLVEPPEFYWRTRARLPWN